MPYDTSILHLAVHTRVCSHTQHRLSLLPSLYKFGKNFFVGRVCISMTCAGRMHLTLLFLCLFVACLPLGSGVYSTGWLPVCRPSV